MPKSHVQHEVIVLKMLGGETVVTRNDVFVRTPHVGVDMLVHEIMCPCTRA